MTYTYDSVDRLCQVTDILGTHTNLIYDTFSADPESDEPVVIEPRIATEEKP